MNMKVNIKVWLEFELAYYVTVQYISHYATETPQEYSGIPLVNTENVVGIDLTVLETNGQKIYLFTKSKSYITCNYKITSN